MDYLTVSQFARRYRVTAQMVRKWIADDRVFAVKIGRDWMLERQQTRPKRMIPGRKKNGTK